MTHIAAQPDRSVIELAGPDRVAFLQGLVSNDVERAAPGVAVWAAVLTPQGKWLADFFILADGERLLLDVERAQAAMLVQRLGRYRLRADASLRELPDWSVYVAWDGAWDGSWNGSWDGAPEAAGAVAAPLAAPLAAPVAAPDPRLPQAGWRIVSPAPLPTDAEPAEWDRHRVALGLPDGSRDLEADKTVLLEAGFDELGGVSWTKGCYMGQELTARTKYRGLVKRRLLPVAAAGALSPGAAVRRDGQEVGTIRSVAGDRALAVLRLDALGAALESGGVAVTPLPPAWAKLPEPA